MKYYNEQLIELRLTAIKNYKSMKDFFVIIIQWPAILLLVKIIIIIMIGFLSWNNINCMFEQQFQELCKISFNINLGIMPLV